MNKKTILSLHFAIAITLPPLIHRNSNSDLKETLIATAIVALAIVPFIIRYCRSAETHAARFMATPTLKNAFCILFPSKPKKSKS